MRKFLILFLCFFLSGCAGNYYTSRIQNYKNLYETNQISRGEYEILVQQLRQEWNSDVENNQEYVRSLKD